MLATKTNQRTRSRLDVVLGVFQVLSGSGSGWDFDDMCSGFMGEQGAAGWGGVRRRLLESVCVEVNVGKVFVPQMSLGALVLQVMTCVFSVTQCTGMSSEDERRDSPLAHLLTETQEVTGATIPTVFYSPPVHHEYPRRLQNVSSPSERGGSASYVIAGG
uniref:Uncharacterized protein n=1 Tax=Knipowitschia caucasica TaxID=637954 RepID=A0AAV2J4X3_KNICA